MNDLRDTLETIERFVPEPEGKPSIATPIVIIAVGIGLLIANIVVSDKWRRLY